jgi:hypothetical protein
MAKTILSGGGLRSNKLVQSRSSKSEPRSHKVTPGAADAIGQTVAYKKPPLEAGRGITSVGPTDNVKAVGVGGGRTTLRCGSQGLHGQVVQGEGPTKGTADRGERSILGPKNS